MIEPRNPTVREGVVTALIQHSLLAPLSDEQQFVTTAIELLKQHGYKAAVVITGRFGFAVSTEGALTIDAHEPADATTIESDGRALGWAMVRGPGGTAPVLRDMLASMTRAAVVSASIAREQARQQAAFVSFQRITTVAATAESLVEIFDAIYHEVSLLLGVDSFSGSIFDEKRSELFFPGSFDRGVRYAPNRSPYVPNSGLTSWMIANRSPIFIRDTFLEPFPVTPHNFGDDEPSRSWVGTPMEAHGQVVGTLSIQSYEPNAFDEADLHLLKQLAQQAALAITSHQSYEEARSRLQEQQVLTELSRDIGARLGVDQLPDLLEIIRQRLAQFMNVDNFYIAIYEAETDSISFPLATENGRRVTWGSRKAGNYLTEHVLAQARPVRTNNIDEYSRSAGILRVGTPAHSWLGVPIWIGGQVIGAMVVQSRDDSVLYNEENERVLVAASAQVAGTIQAAWLLSDSKRQLAELEELTQRQSSLLNVIRELSTPVIPILEGVLVLPIVGGIDSVRAASILNDMLAAVSSQRAQVVLIDITGVPVVDTSVANYLLQAMRATQLLGARCVLVGIRPEVAQTMVGLGVDMRGVETLANLQEGIRFALALQGLRIARAEER